MSPTYWGEGVADVVANKSMLPYDTISVMYARSRIAMLCVLPRDIAQHFGKTSAGLSAAKASDANSMYRSKTFVHSRSSIEESDNALPDYAHLLN